MVRIFFTYLIPFLVPLAAYLVWAWYRIAHAKKHGGEAPVIEKGPLPWLLLAGAVLTLVLMGTTALLRGGDPDATYVPPRYEDGRIVPGRMED
jgi:heme A synthase